MSENVGLCLCMLDLKPWGLDTRAGVARLLCAGGEKNKCSTNLVGKNIHLLNRGTALPSHSVLSCALLKLFSGLNCHINPHLKTLLLIS